MAARGRSAHSPVACPQPPALKAADASAALTPLPPPRRPLPAARVQVGHCRRPRRVRPALAARPAARGRRGLRARRARVARAARFDAAALGGAHAAAAGCERTMPSAPRAAPPPASASSLAGVERPDSREAERPPRARQLPPSWPLRIEPRPSRARRPLRARAPPPPARPPQAQVQRFGREAADGCEPRFRSMLAEYFEAVQVPPDELACSMAADLGRTNCTVHALRRRAVGAHVPRPLALAAADGGSEGGPRVRNGGGAAGDEQHGARAKRPRLARVM